MGNHGGKFSNAVRQSCCKLFEEVDQGNFVQTQYFTQFGRIYLLKIALEVNKDECCQHAMMWYDNIVPFVRVLLNQFVLILHL